MISLQTSTHACACTHKGIDVHQVLLSFFAKSFERVNQEL
uniref:Uncharacterized protein n=1 Tax=Rhizophora mucronata TaxID=61149 RepID=A0A2P2PQT1_RHIMU